MSSQTPHHPDSDRDDGHEPTRDAHAEALAGNPYASQYQQRAEEADLDAGAPQLRSSELRRMNRRALLLLGAVVLLLLFVAYWMIQSATSHHEQAKPREEKVTVAEAPAAITMPQLPRAAPAPQAAQPIPLMPAPTRTPPLPSAPPASPMSREASLVQRRIMASANGAENQPATPPAVLSSGNGLPGSADSDLTSAQSLTKPDTLMQRGTYIRCVLETRIISDISGYTTCLVTEPVYSFNGHTLLLPKGSKVLGAYQKQPNQRRVEVIWDRIITPTGIDVSMKSPGIDNLGGAGLPGHYDAHWSSRIGAALLVSMLSDAFKYEAAEHGPRTTTISNGLVTQEPFQSNTAQTVQDLAGQAVREAANRPSTVTINQGTIIYVYVAKDVDFSGVVARF